MPTSADRKPDLLVDTSVAMALCVADHPAHDDARGELGGKLLGLAGHASFETLSVLTRLPAPSRRSPTGAAKMIATNFPASRHLSAAAAAALVEELAEAGISGGAIYDGLVAGAAREHRLRLATRDGRALETYRAIGTSIELIGEAP